MSLIPETSSPSGPRDPPPAQVWLSRVAVRGFRCLEDLVVDLDPGTTYLVGENNTGKTSLLLALSAAFGRHRPTADDLFRQQDGSSVERAVVDLFFAPHHGDSFGPHERGAFGGNVHRLKGEAREFAGIRSTFSPSLEGGPLPVQRRFLQPGRIDLVESPTAYVRSEERRVGKECA